MAENKYLNEEKYQQNVQHLKKIGKILLIVGICMFALGALFVLLGFIGFGKTGIGAVSDVGLSDEQTARGILGGVGLFVIGGFLDSGGFFIAAIGGVIMFIAHRREIAAFATQQVMPVAKEGINEMAPVIGNAAGEIAKGIKKGLKEADKEE